VPLAAALATIAAATQAASLLFVGNSLLYGEGSPAREYRTDLVADLNGARVGGVPALFATFAREAGLDYAVSAETVPGVGLDHHYENRRAVLDRAWDEVVLSGYSTLDRDHPGDPATLVRYAGRFAALFHCRNRSVIVHLNSTWTRADQTYPESGHWYGRPVPAMAIDVRAGNDAAARASPFIRDVIPVGEAWNRAFATGVADPNPNDGIAPGQLDLWAADQYHASTAGYYLEALVIFGTLTHRDPLALGSAEQAAVELGLMPAQVHALEQVAHDQLAAEAARPRPKAKPRIVAEPCATQPAPAR
jgi:hypothetical protein